MPDHEEPDPGHAQPGGQRPPPLPEGYRQGVITAITVLLGFSLGFLKFWGLEAPGGWGALSFLSTATLILAVLGQIRALYRALMVADNDEHEYRKTVRWFVASAIVLLAGLVLSFFDSA
jgi:hypothetical protein